MNETSIEVRIESAKRGVMYHANECERALRSAAFAESESSLGESMAVCLRKLAAYHSEGAFSWAQSLARLEAML